MRKLVLIPHDKYQRMSNPPEASEILQNPPEERDQSLYLETPLQNPSKPPPLDDELIILSLPKLMRPKGRQILNLLKSFSNLSWDPAGHISLKDSFFPGAHISDYIRQTLSPSRKENLEAFPIWYKEVVKNLPLHLIHHTLRPNIFKAPFPTATASKKPEQKKKKKEKLVLPIIPTKTSEEITSQPAPPPGEPTDSAIARSLEAPAKSEWVTLQL